VFKKFSTRGEAEQFKLANAAPSQQQNQHDQGCSSSASSAGAGGSRKRDQPSGSLAQDSGHVFVSGGLLSPSTSPEKRSRSGSLSSPFASRNDSVVCLGSSRSDSVVCLDSPPSSREDRGASGSSESGPLDDGPIVIDDDEIMHEVVKDGKHDDQLCDYKAKHREQHSSNGAKMMVAQEGVATNEFGGSAGGGSSRGYPIASGDGVGARMMGQMGYTGGGLGSNGQGIQEPIQARPRDGRAGLGGENEGLELDDCQQAAFDACMGNNNVFLTGRGGSGKTFLLKVTHPPQVFAWSVVTALSFTPALLYSGDEGSRINIFFQ